MFKRIAASVDTNNNAIIKFFWVTSELFNSVQLRTSYRAKLLKNNVGESQLDDFAISPQERKIFVEYLDDVVYELATAMFKLTQGIDTSVFVDTKEALIFSIGGELIDGNGCALAEIAPQGPEIYPLYKVTAEWGGFAIGDYVYLSDPGAGTFTKTLPVEASGFSIIDNAAFNSNVLPTIDKKMKNCIKYFVMREWYGSVGLKEELASNNELYQLHLIATKNLTHELRKPLMI